MTSLKTAILIAATSAALGCATVVAMMPAVPEPFLFTLYFETEQGLLRRTCRQITVRYGLFGLAEMDQHLSEVKIEPGTPEYEPGLQAAKNHDRILTGPLGASATPLPQTIASLPATTR